MTENQYSQYLLGTILIAIVGSIFNIAKYKTRGKSALFLSGAFLTFALTTFLIKIAAGQIWIALGGAATFGLIMADAVFRLGRQSTGARK